jgi:hypothetical protein
MEMADATSARVAPLLKLAAEAASRVFFAGAKSASIQAFFSSCKDASSHFDGPAELLHLLAGHLSPDTLMRLTLLRPNLYEDDEWCLDDWLR